MTHALAFDLPGDDFEGEDLPWFIEPKDRDPAPEAKRQRAFLSALARQAPAVHAFAVPNGGKQSDWGRLNSWRTGTVAGALDLVIFWNHGVMFAEMKDGTGMPSRQQRAMLNSLYAAGHRCGVYRRPTTLLAHLREAGAPFL